MAKYDVLEMSTDDAKPGGTVDALARLAEAIPLYQDLIQPAAKEVGTALGNTAKVINIALTPVSALIWGYDQLRSYLLRTLAERMQDVPPEHIRTPDPSVLCPAVETLRYNAHKETLRELYLQLIVTSLDARTAEYAHPAFVEVIKSLSPDEARILAFLKKQPVNSVLDFYLRYAIGDHLILQDSQFSDIAEHARCEVPNLVRAYLDNLLRLRLIDVVDLGLAQVGGPGPSAEWFRSIERHPVVKTFLQQTDNYNKNKSAGDGSIDYALNGPAVPLVRRKLLSLTHFGKQFCKACVDTAA